MRRIDLGGCTLSMLGMLGITLLGCSEAKEPVYLQDGWTCIGPECGIERPWTHLAGIGDPCTATTQCRPGLSCEASGTCQPAGTQAVGLPCVVTAECMEGAYCAIQTHCKGKHLVQDTGCRIDLDCQTANDPEAKCVANPEDPNMYCQKQGNGEEGALCSTDGDCLGGLFCKLIGLTGACSQGGTGGFEAPCKEAADCYPGLVCGDQGTCTTWLLALSAAQKWETPCEANESSNPRVYFEIPGSEGYPKADFYRLPYPNDIRMADGLVALGHPAPGPGPLDFDPVQRLLDAVNKGMKGWGTTPTVTFRFSEPLEFDSVDYSDDDANLRYVNIDEDSPHYGHPKGYVWGAGDGRGGKYVCQNWLTVRNHWSDPLDPHTTYAVLLLKGMKNREDKLFGADEHLEQLLTDASVSLPHGAWEKYAPLRAYLKAEAIGYDQIIGAAVFTTGTPHERMKPAREVIRAQQSPKLGEVVLCEPGVKSPCEVEGDETRGCPKTASASFYELQGTIGLPAFQTGTVPYVSPADGGTMAIGAGNTPVVDRFEDVCFTLTIPKGASQPAGGWPVVLYAHGTGGNYRSHAANGTAAMLSDIDANASGGGTAVLGIDGVAHGPRRMSELSPETLFYNFANPGAARDNVFQGAFDYFTLVRWIEEFSGELSSLKGLDFDDARIGFLGHSQGSTTGALFAAFEPKVSTVVLSGAGAGLTESLLGKTSPANIPAGVQAVLREPASSTHPVLSLMQQFFDPVDSINYGRLLTKELPDEMPGRNILVIYGQGDTFTPPKTTRILADVLGLSIMAPALDTGKGEAFEGYLAGEGGDPETDRVVDGPITATFDIGGQKVALGMTHYAPDTGGDGKPAYDGHFVLTRKPAAKKQVGSFFATAFKDGAAQIVLP